MQTLNLINIQTTNIHRILQQNPFAFTARHINDTEALLAI